MKFIIKKEKKTENVLYWLVFILLIAVAAIVVISAIDIPGNYRLLSVQSGSMEPSIPLGSMVFTKREADYKIGDVITFYNSGDTRYLITHRISAIEYPEDGELYITKGDANEDADREKVDERLVAGKVIWTLPVIGYAVSFTKTRVGLMLLVVIPATLIIYSEVLAIKREILKRKRKYRSKRKSLLLGLVLFLFVIQISGTSSSYVDIETSNGNSMTAGVWGEEMELLFYLREDERAVGFVIQGITGYDSLEYVIEYEHDGGLLEHIEGTIDNSSNSDAVLREWFLLGSCSSEGLVCVYHEKIAEINLSINDTLKRTITF